MKLSCITDYSKLHELLSPRYGVCLFTGPSSSIEKWDNWVYRTVGWVKGLYGKLGFPGWLLPRYGCLRYNLVS